MDPDPDPVIFVSDLQDVNQKLFFCLLLFEVTFSLFFKDKKSKRSHTVGIIVFLLFLLDDCSTTGKPTRSFATERVSLDSV